MDAVKRIQALDELHDHLSRELDTTADPERKGAVNVEFELRLAPSITLITRIRRISPLACVVLTK